MLKYVCLLMLFAGKLVAQPLPGNSQNGGTGSNLADHMMIQDAKRSAGLIDTEPIDGSPYLNDEFENGSVYTAKGTYTAVSMRYNIQADYIEFKEKTATYILDARPDVKKVSLGDKNFIADSYKVKGTVKRGFFIVLDSGKVTLLQKKNMILRPPQAPKALETDGKPAKYEKQADDFAFKIGGGPIIEISSVKKMVESFPDHKDEVNKFVSKERISKNEKDLIKLVKYYNQL